MRNLPDPAIPENPFWMHNWTGRLADTAKEAYAQPRGKSFQQQRRLVPIRGFTADEARLCRTKDGLAQCIKALGCQGKKVHGASRINVPGENVR